MSIEEIIKGIPLERLTEICDAERQGEGAADKKLERLEYQDALISAYQALLKQSTELCAKLLESLKQLAR